MKASSNFYVAAVVIAGFALCGYLYANGGGAQLPAIIIAIGVFAKLFNTDAKVEASTEVSKANAAALVDVKAVAVQNTNQLAAVSQQTSDGLDAVNHKVDGHQQELMEEIRSKNATVDRLTQENAALKQAAALKAEQQTTADSNTQQIMASNRAAIQEAAALAPPDHAPAGSTPTGTTIAGPVTITPLGDTTIVMPPTDPSVVP